MLFSKQRLSKIKIRLRHTNRATHLEFISKTWCCWHGVTLHERYPSNCLRGKGGAVYCVLDACPCCRMIVWLRRMINVMLKGSEGKSLRTCPPTVMANKDSLNVGLLKIQEKVEDGGLFFFFLPIHTCTFSSVTCSRANIYTGWNISRHSFTYVHSSWYSQKQAAP